jgi:hypothetical protein
VEILFSIFTKIDQLRSSIGGAHRLSGCSAGQSGEADLLGLHRGRRTLI